MMYPVFLNLARKKCLVVGGGKVAVRKVIALLRAKAQVTVITKESSRQMSRLAPLINLQIRPFSDDDLSRTSFLVIGATNDQAVNKRISQRAETLNIPCNIVDQTPLCSFVVPAQVRRGEVTVAIATGGVSPRLSGYLKKEVAKVVLPVHGELAAYLGTIRKRLYTELPEISLRNGFWSELFSRDPVQEIDEHGWEAFYSRVESLITWYSQKIGTNEKV
jgi:siroheme synthase-like protein